MILKTFLIWVYGVLLPSVKNLNISMGQISILYQKSFSVVYSLGTGILH